MHRFWVFVYFAAKYTEEYWAISDPNLGGESRAISRYMSNHYADWLIEVLYANDIRVISKDVTLRTIRRAFPDINISETAEES